MTAPPKVVGYDLTPSAYDTTAETDRNAALQARLVLGGLAASRHPCQLSKATGTTTCRHPDHPRDREQLRTALLTLGLIETRVREPATGRCPGCKRAHRLNNDGRMAAHDGLNGDRCAGWRQAPESCDAP